MECYNLAEGARSPPPMEIEREPGPSRPEGSHRPRRPLSGRSVGADPRVVGALGFTLSLMVLALAPLALTALTGSSSAVVMLAGLGGEGHPTPPLLVPPEGARASLLPGAAPARLPSASASCTSDQGLPLALGEPFNTSLPWVGNAQPCVLSQNLSVGSPAGALIVWGTNDITVAATMGNRTLTMDVAGSLTIGSGSVFQVAEGTGLRIALQGTLTILPGGNLSLSANSSLILGVGARVAVDGGMLFTHGPPIVADGGSISVSGEGVLDGSAGGPSPSLAGPRVSHINVTGSLTAFNDSDSAIDWFQAANPGNVGAFSVQGFPSQPLSVANLTVNSTGPFRADGVSLSGVALTSAASVELGVPGLVPDTVLVNGFTVGKALTSLVLAHAQVASLAVSSVAQVEIENSSLGPGASSVPAAATGGFSANQSSHFGFPVVLNNPHWANLTNASAPSLTVNGQEASNIDVYNWDDPTTSSNGVWSLPSITTASPQVSVHVYRYLLVSVTPVAPTVQPSVVSVTLCGSANGASSGPACQTLGVDAQGDVGRFVATDVVTLNGVDTFEGSYSASASARGTGYSAGSQSIEVTSDDETLPLAMTLPPVPPQLVAVFLLEVAGVGVVVGAIVLLRTWSRRLTRPKALSKPSEAPAKEVTPEKEGGTPSSSTEATEVRRPPAQEWKPPTP